MAKKNHKNAVEKYPTGYAPSALPFYSKLDEKEFEHFCTDLLNREPIIMVMKDGKAATRKILEATLLLSGKEPQKGADILAKDDCGEVWIFQCKHVQSFGPTDVSKVIEDAEKGFPQADHYVLVITCGLSEPALQLIRNRPKWLLPWDADRLTTAVFKFKLSDASSLVRAHFGPEMAKRLFPGSDLRLLEWHDFFRRDLAKKDKHFRHTISFIDWGGALQKLEDFARNSAGRALILNAAGGQGKSRLLLELAKKIENTPSRIPVRFLNINRCGLSSEQADFLGEQTGDLLLIIDDAHRLGNAIADVAQATEKSKLLRLLVVTRPQAVDAISSQLYQNGFSERLDEPLDLPRWEPDDICKLADKVVKPEHCAQTNVLVDLADRCPLLIVLGADLINSGEHISALTDQRAFRERVFKSFKDDFLSHYPEPRRGRLSRVISFLSFVSPTKKDDTLLENAAKVLGYSQLDVADDLDALDSAGLLAENWEGIRLYPDLFSDAVLLNACLDSRCRPSSMHKTVLDSLKLRDFPALIRNVAQADWESRSRHGVSGSLFDPIWFKFVEDFKAGRWPQGENDFLEHWLGENPSLRAVMLEWWEPVAVFLPERTLELAGLAIQCMASPNDREWACRNVPPLLKTIVERHPKYAEQALDLLWTLATLGTEGNNEYPFAAITAIAEAASFNSQKEIKVTELVLSWLERKFKEPATIEFLRRPKWILSALLKPFFVTELGDGAAVRLGTLRIRSEKTRPIRQRILAIIDCFLRSSDTRLGCALIPVLAEAINPGQWVPKEHLETWRQECLDAFKVIESAIESHSDSVTLLVLLRKLLRNRGLQQHLAVHAERDRLLQMIPETLELRVATALSSYAHLEFPGSRDEKGLLDPMKSEENWQEFNQKVANEIFDRFQSPAQACEFLQCAATELRDVGQSVNPGTLVQRLLQAHPEWCAPVLNGLLEAKKDVLDHSIWDALFCARKDAHEQYREAVEYLPLYGRPTQVTRLIHLLGFMQVNFKQFKIAPLDPLEREAVLHAAKRTECNVVSELAWLCGFPLANEPGFAMEVLSQLPGADEKSASAIMLALGEIAKDHASEMEAQKVAKCLGNVGEFCFPESSPNEFGLTIIAQKFPKEVYEHVRHIYQNRESNPTPTRTLQTSNIPSFGPIADSEYVDNEIHALWDQAFKPGVEGFSREFRFALIRSLVWSNAATALDRTRSFVNACKNAGEIKLLAELVGVRPSRFVLDHPDIVRLLLARAQEFAATKDVSKTLILSACGGGRTYTDTELDPEYKYILEQGDALANRYRDDSVLHDFYREIADWERSDLVYQQKRRKSH